jgi:acyl carrier protein|tara:strand:+ start:274 stop:516 length:243 start_codon:yes stop_codon:yes gene_type:complete
MESTEQRVYGILSDVFGIPLDKVNSDTSPDNVPEWDSVSHINIVLSLEAEFGIALTPEDSMEMLSTRLILIILEERGLVD